MLYEIDSNDQFMLKFKNYKTKKKKKKIKQEK